MSVFAKSTFSASIYSASRPTYPSKLFEHIFDFHKRGKNARWETAVDVGCGTGQATLHLKGKFKRVLCTDPSAGMLSKAQEYVENAPSVEPSATQGSALSNDTQFTFSQGTAEDLRNAIPNDGTVDLMIAAQACHWFDWSKVWPETRRVLRRGGTAAFWVYAEVRFPAFPSLTPLITTYAQGTDPQSTSSVGPYFQRPGRTILERMLVDVPAPEEVQPEIGLHDFTRVYFSGTHPVPTRATHSSRSSTDSGADAATSGAETHPVLMRTQWRWIDFLGYLRTWSALHSYHERFPEDKSREEDTRFLEQDLEDLTHNVEAGNGISVRGGDVAVRFWKDLREGARKELEAQKDRNNALEVDRGTGLFDTLSVEWPVALLLARRE